MMSDVSRFLTTDVYAALPESVGDTASGTKLCGSEFSVVGWVLTN
jgi:hypothetical protein